MINLGMLAGVLLVIVIVATVAVISGRNVKSTQEFTVAGRRAAWPAVSGILVGALVGVSSTVGTAQAAFVYGLRPGGSRSGAASAVWFWARFSPSPSETPISKRCRISW
ncbi:MAG TPA: hypothetical protein VIJ06_03605 [Methylovirgula sp.]